MKKYDSMSPILMKRGSIKKKRRNSAPDSTFEKNLEINKHFQKKNKRDNSSQTDFDIAWGPVFINFFLGIFLPTLDVGTDFLFVIGKLEELYVESPDQIFLTQEEASKCLINIIIKYVLPTSI